MSEPEKTDSNVLRFRLTSIIDAYEAVRPSTPSIIVDSIIDFLEESQKYGQIESHRFSDASIESIVVLKSDQETKTNENKSAEQWTQLSNQESMETNESHMSTGKNEESRMLRIAVDVGCGTGQSTFVLKPYFDRVFGFDVSPIQIEHACHHQVDGVEFNVASAENLPLQSESVDLVTAGISLQWFELDRFYQELNRILKPGGIFAAYFYHKPIVYESDGVTFSDTFTSIIRQSAQYLSQFMPRRKRLIVVNQFKELKLPLIDERHKNFQFKFPCHVTDVITLIESWSTYEQLIATNERQAKIFIKKIRQFLKEKCKQRHQSIEECMIFFQYDYNLIMLRKEPKITEIACQSVSEMQSDVMRKNKESMS